MLGLEHLEGVRWDDVPSPAWTALDEHDIRVGALPAEDDVAVLAARSAAPADWRLIAETLDALAAQADVVVVDCGPRPSPALLSSLDVVVVVTRLTAKGLRDAEMVEERCELARTHPVLASRGAARDRSGVDAARWLAMPFLAHWADDPRVSRYDAQGWLPGTRTTSVDSVADQALRMLQTRWLSALVDRMAPAPRPRRRSR